MCFPVFPFMVLCYYYFCFVLFRRGPLWGGVFRRGGFSPSRCFFLVPQCRSGEFLLPGFCCFGTV